MAFDESPWIWPISCKWQPEAEEGDLQTIGGNPKQGEMYSHCEYLRFEVFSPTCESIEWKLYFITHLVLSSLLSAQMSFSEQTLVSWVSKEGLWKHFSNEKSEQLLVNFLHFYEMCFQLVPGTLSWGLGLGLGLTMILQKLMPMYMDLMSH